jgi:hypothetical protein
MIVIRNKGTIFERGVVHVFVRQGSEFRALCGVKADFPASEMRTLAEDILSEDGAERAVERFKRVRDGCERCAVWLEKNWDALVVAERLAATR